MNEDNQYNITNVDMNDEYYNIEQSLVRNKYKVTDKNGDVILKGKQKMLKMKEEFPFVTGDGKNAFTVKSSGVIDIAGSYALIDSVTGEEVVILDEKFSILDEKWKIRSPDTNDIIATIESKNKILSGLRHFSDIANIFPNKYEIFDSNSQKIGEIAGEFSMKDTYKVTVDNNSNVPREAIMASACIIDALENK